MPASPIGSPAAQAGSPPHTGSASLDAMGVDLLRAVMRKLPRLEDRAALSWCSRVAFDAWMTYSWSRDDYPSAVVHIAHPSHQEPRFWLAAIRERRAFLPLVAEPLSTVYRRKAPDHYHHERQWACALLFLSDKLDRCRELLRRLGSEGSIPWAMPLDQYSSVHFYFPHIATALAGQHRYTEASAYQQAGAVANKLIEACRWGNHAAVSSIVAQGVEVSAWLVTSAGPGPGAQSALADAFAQRGDVAAVRLILEILQNSALRLRYIDLRPRLEMSEVVFACTLGRHYEWVDIISSQPASSQNIIALSTSLRCCLIDLYWSQDHWRRLSKKFYTPEFVDHLLSGEGGRLRQFGDSSPVGLLACLSENILLTPAEKRERLGFIAHVCMQAAVPIPSAVAQAAGRLETASLRAAKSRRLPRRR